ncbi:MAG: hypothetical protein QGH61_03270 [Candidatus Marinimicrobia bacterium]|nr:hypothetical protein [Candidatus Neomarinimicrobiota bacterium]
MPGIAHPVTMRANGDWWVMAEGDKSYAYNSHLFLQRDKLVGQTKNLKKSWKK